MIERGALTKGGKKDIMRGREEKKKKVERTLRTLCASAEIGCRSGAAMKGAGGGA